MSKVVIQGNASGTGDFSIAAPNSNTDRTLTLPDVTGNVVTTGDTSTVTEAMINGSLGKVLQVVQTTKTDTFTTQSQSFVDITGLSVAITPSSASNKILVSYTIQVGTNGYCDIRLLRGSTNIALGDAASPRTQSTTHQGGPVATASETFAIQWLDSPSTTSATTYKLQGAVPYSASYILTINRTGADYAQSHDARTVSTITAMEISA